MQFNSYSYLGMLLLTVAVFWALPVCARRWYVLAVSIGFYATWSPTFVVVPVVLCIGVFFMAQSVSASGKSDWYVAALTYALAFLIVFRYQGAIGAALGALAKGFRLAPGRTMFQVVVPLGISFYTLEAVSYLIDVRQKRVQPVRFSDLYLFVMFWPHLIAGPIVRFNELKPQFRFEKKFAIPMLIAGMDRLVWGLVQKNVLADPLGRFVAEGFSVQDSMANTPLDNWFLAVAFGLQIYFDFAAYSNMAIGAASMIGLTLPENFRFPYWASNPSDFWQRWHITLSRWIRDYLFFPINLRFQGAPLPLYVSLLGIMGVVGLWHGVGWGFIVFGLMHGCYLTAYRIWEKLRQGLLPAAGPSRLALALWRVATLVAVIAAWVPFRAATVQQAAAMLRSMFFGFNPRISFSLDSYLVTLLVCAVCALEPFLKDWIDKLDGLTQRNAQLALANTHLVRPALYAFGLLLFVIFDDRTTQFIYFQF
ncbi:MAG: MBOAT family O-acyltransferase [Candidatus Acidiferrales bacterium]|jgi:D-alanyl-lipoteichoic acid acyltransferase DltB (MBOAT superfamily)